MYTLSTQIDDRKHSWFGTGTSIQNDGVELVSWSQASLLSQMMWSHKCFPYMSKMPSLTL
jgi:hypothetical protein